MMQYEQEFLDTIPSIQRHVRFRMGERGEDYEDVVGDAIVSGIAFIESGKFKEGSSLKTLMISIALNKARDHFRKRAVTGKVFYRYVNETRQVHDFNRDEYMLPEYLAEIVGKLPAKQKLAVLCYLYDDASLAEIAREYGYHYVTVRSWFKRARDRMLRMLVEPRLRADHTEQAEKEDELSFIDSKTKERLEWLVKMHNAYIFMCKTSPGMPGVDAMIEDATSARDEIAQILVCGEDLSKILSNDYETISYLLAERRPS